MSFSPNFRHSRARSGRRDSADYAAGQPGREKFTKQYKQHHGSVLGPESTYTSTTTSQTVWYYRRLLEWKHRTGKTNPAVRYKISKPTQFVRSTTAASTSKLNTVSQPIYLDDAQLLRRSSSGPSCLSLLAIRCDSIIRHRLQFLLF